MSLAFLTNEERVNRDMWLKELKPGDVVCRTSPQNWGDPRYDKVTIKKVTPSGLIRIEESEGAFRADGTVRAASSWENGQYLEPWTSSIESMLARRKLEQAVWSSVHLVHRDKLKLASDEDLKALLPILRKLRIDKDKEE